MAGWTTPRSTYCTVPQNPGRRASPMYIWQLPTALNYQALRGAFAACAKHTIRLAHRGGVTTSQVVQLLSLFIGSELHNCLIRYRKLAGGLLVAYFVSGKRSNNTRKRKLLHNTMWPLRQYSWCDGRLLLYTQFLQLHGSLLYPNRHMI